MICPVCQEEVWVAKFLFYHRKKCLRVQKEKELTRMRNLAIARLQEVWAPQSRKSKGNAA
jgi:hypothetical protein